MGQPSPFLFCLGDEPFPLESIRSLAALAALGYNNTHPFIPNQSSVKSDNTPQVDSNHINSFNASIE